MSWRGMVEDIILTFAALLYYFWGTKKELIGGVSSYFAGKVAAVAARDKEDDAE